MTNEEMEREMEFIVDIEAKSRAMIDALAEAHKRGDERWARADERWARTEESIRALLTIAEMHEREINSIGEQTRATDERLNALINVVERQISDGRNGKRSEEHTSELQSHLNLVCRL